MVKLIAKSPCAGLLPLTLGAAELSEVDPGQVTCLQPYAGKDVSVGKALQMAIGCGLPDVGGSRQHGEALVQWFGKGTYICLGVDLPETLSQEAATTDQSDAWAVVSLRGASAEAVLARLVPVDLRLSAFVVGSACRTLLQHMNVAILRTGEDSFQIMVFRSMAKTLVHDLEQAMAGVAARSGL